MENTKIDFYAIVELFGHQKVAGKCSEQNIAGTNMLRVDIPETDKQPALTKYYGGSAIYAISPVDERTAVLAANNLEVAPIYTWQGSAFIEKFKPALIENNNDVIDPDFEDDEMPPL